MNSFPLSIRAGDTSLRVTFEWVNDRFVHRIETGEGPALATIDGTPQDAWPPSPPIQQLSLESLAGGDTLLGVGAAGVSHWSVSVDAVEDAQGNGLRFDWACRIKTPPEFLGCTYSLRGTGSGAADAGDGTANFQIDSLEGKIEQSEGGRIRVIRVDSVSASEWGCPATKRWTYVVRLSQPPRAASASAD